MNSYYSFEIADTLLFIENISRYNFNLPGGYYSQFLSSLNRQIESDIKIQVQFGNLPLIRDKTEIFDTGLLWKIFQDKSYKYIYFKSNQPGEPSKIIRANRDYTGIKLFLNEKIYLADKRPEQITGKKPNLKTTKLSLPVTYPVDQMILINYLGQRDGMIIHSSGIQFRDKIYIFPGKSGAGKSTLSDLLKSNTEFTVINDDRIILRDTDSSFMAYGNPWPGELGVTLNKSRPLSGIFFINKGSKNYIKELSQKKAVEKFMPVVSIPWYDKAITINIMDLIGKLVNRIPVFDLHFKPGREIAGIIEEKIDNWI